MRFRRRLEALPSADVGRYTGAPQDSSIVDYLDRLLVFSREQEAWRAAPAGERLSITFIMGEDGASDNRFYASAADYYRYNLEARTEIVELSCRSLVEVRNYLEAHRPANLRPWGVVNIVTHSYEWGGLAVPIERGQGRTDAAALRLARFRPLGDSVADCRTEFRIQGCALGRDTALLRLLGLAFGGSDLDRPMVASSRCLVFYESLREPGRPPATDRFLAEYWYVTYPKARRPGNNELARRLGAGHPGVLIDWHASLSRPRPRWPGDEWSHIYELPITWLAVYADTLARPRLLTRRDEMAWLESVPELADWLKATGLETPDLLWSIRDTTVVDCDTVRPAVLAFGRAKVVSVEREVVVPDARMPWIVRRAHLREGGPEFQTTVAAVVPATRPAGENVPFPD